MKSKLVLAAIAAIMSGIDFIPLPRNSSRQLQRKQPKDKNEAVKPLAKAKRDRKNQLRLERMKK